MDFGRIEWVERGIRPIKGVGVRLNDLHISNLCLQLS